MQKKNEILASNKKKSKKIKTKTQKQKPE